MTRDTPFERTETTETPTETPTDDAPTGGFEFSRHPAVAPPGWDPTKTESGDGLNDRRAVFVLQNIDNPFFIPMACGFNDAVHQYGWTGGVKGPGAAGGLQDQVNIIEDEVDRMEAGDVIVTTILNETTYNDAIQQALDNDIVVVNGHSTPARREWNYETMREEFTYTSPVTGEDRGMIIPHVGIRNERGGVAMAVEMHDRLQNQRPDQNTYTVFLVNDLPDNPSVTRRIDKEAADEGTAQRYFEAQDDVSIYQDQVFTTPQPPEIADARDFIVDTIQDQEVDAIVSAAFWGAAGAGDALAASELDGPVVIGTFDVLEPLFSRVRDGHVDFTLGQDPYSQGYASASTARAYLERGVPPKDLEWGVSVWDERNIEFASQRRSWSDLLDWQSENYDGIE